MKKEELLNDATMMKFKIRLRPSNSYWRKCIHSMGFFTEFTGKTPKELYDEADEEEEARVRLSKRKIVDLLANYKYYLNYEYKIKDGKTLAPKSIHTYYGCVESFYKYLGIELPKCVMREDYPVPTDENTQLAKIDDVRRVLDKCDTRDRAMLLCGVSSSLGAAELSKLKLQTFYDGLDEETQITAIRIRREKTRSKSREYVTFFSPEATRAVLAYLKLRDTPTNSNKQEYINTSLKQKTMPNSYLFIAQNIPKEYLENGDEELRRFTSSAIGQRFRKLSNHAALDTKDGYNIIRSHNMRKIFANTLKLNGCNNTLVEFMMGHKIPRTENAYFISSQDIVSQESINIMRKEYSKFTSYLIVQKDLAIAENPEFIKKDEEVEKLKAENKLLKVERSEHIKQNERLEALEKRDQINNGMNLLRGKKYEYEDLNGNIVKAKFDEDNEVIKTLKLYLDDGEEGVRRRDVELYGEDLVKEIEAEMEAEGIEEKIRRKYKQNIRLE
ncbi:MAG: tyrosine-type recombinase/integrase [Methanolobus sp.]|nr:tyrosine-type recombinase/integrase [Methanolobus sp.]